MSWLFASGNQKYWSFSFPMKYSGLVSFRTDWLDLLAVQGTVKSLLQHHSSKASIFWCSVFSIVQLLHLSMTTGKTIPLPIQTFVGEVIAQLFSMLSSFAVAFFPRIMCLFISWLQSLSTVILKPKKIQLVTGSIFPPSICHEMMDGMP